MEMTFKVHFLALGITVFLLISLFIFRDFMNNARENAIESKVKSISSDLTKIQTLLLISEVYGNDLACLAFDRMIKKLDKSVWDLGTKLDQYRLASEDFFKDPFYLDQKKIFNNNEMLYLVMSNKLNADCGFNKSIISFYYRNSGDCPKCDDQSFVLTDVKRKLKENVSIFSFDADLGLDNVDLFVDFYNLSGFPCLIINEKRFCGMVDEKTIMNNLCGSSNSSVC